jgi:hypothetical protein
MVWDFCTTCQQIAIAEEGSRELDCGSGASAEIRAQPKRKPALAWPGTQVPKSVRDT